MLPSGAGSGSGSSTVSHSKKRSWFIRIMRKYEITPQRAGMWLCFGCAFLFLLFHFISTTLHPPPASSLPEPPAAPLTPDGAAFAVSHGPGVTVLKSKDADAMEEAHRAALLQAGQLPNSDVHAPMADRGGKELDRFYSAARLKEQGSVLGDSVLQGRYEGGLGQPKQLRPPVILSPGAASAASTVSPASAAAFAPRTPDARPPSRPSPSLSVDDASSVKADADASLPRAATKPTPSVASSLGDEPISSKSSKAASDKPVASSKTSAADDGDEPSPAPKSSKATDADKDASASDKKSKSSPFGEGTDAVGKDSPKDSAPSKPSAAAAGKSSSSSAAVGKNSHSALTSPSAPLGDDVDVSRLYDTSERRAAREAAHKASASEPLPAAVQKRHINNVPLHPEKPMNEEWREELLTKQKVIVRAPGVATSFTSPDGGLELSVFLTAEGGIGYSMAMRAQYSTLARTMLQEGSVNSLEDLEGTFLLPALLDLSVDNHLCTLDTKSTPGEAQVNYRLTKGFSLWHPVPKAERSEYAESWTQLSLWNGVSSGKKGKPTEPELGKCGAFEVQFRLFNTGFAIRALVQPTYKAPSPDPDSFPDEGEFVVVHWSMGLRLQDGITSSRCVANNYEEPFVRLECGKLSEAMMTPVTMEMSPKISSSASSGVKNAGRVTHGPHFMAVVQASGPAFVRSTAVAAPSDPARPHRTELIIVTRGEAPVLPKDPDTLGVVSVDDRPGAKDGALATATSWHVILFAAALRHLPHTSHLTPLLCDPPPPSKPDWVDSRWVPSGKLLRITKFSTSMSKAIIDWVSSPAAQFSLVHFDAGWYGDEYKKESSAKQVLPQFASELDIAAVARYANSKGLRLCLYVNELALRDTKDLCRIYAEWGVGGVKFGFVEVGTPRAMRVLHQRVVAFGNAGMYVNIHDSYRPRGLTRSFPFLVTQEGVRGEERKPDATHHTILPFVRTLQGSADYTPRYLNGAGLRCTKAHQLALPLVLYSPIQSLFWAEPLEPVSRAVTEWNRELNIWTRMPASWDDTRFLAGRLGEFVHVARRDGNDWFVAALTNEQERGGVIDLNVLFDEWAGHPALPSSPPVRTLGYLVHSYRDGPVRRPDPFSVKVAPRKLFWLAPPKRKGEKAVKPPVAGLDSIPDGKFQLEMFPSGGHALFLTPATPAALKEAGLG